MVPDMGVPETCVCTKRSSNYEYNQPFKCPVNPSRYDDYGSNCDPVQDPLSELNITSKVIFQVDMKYIELTFLRSHNFMN